MENRNGGSALIAGIVALVMFFVICSMLSSAFGDTFRVAGNAFLVDFFLLVHYAIWILGGLAILAILAIIARIALPTIGDWYLDRAEAQKVRMESSHSVVAGFGGSEIFIKHHPSGQMTVYDPVENLINRIASGGLDHVLTEAISRIIHQQPASKIGRIENTYAQQNDGVPLLTEPQPALLPSIQNLDNILIVGGKGTGKTTLLQHLEAQRVHQGKVIVLDTHAQPAKWRGTVVGIGRNYKLIKNAMISIVNLLDNRYKSYATGQSNFEPINTFIDEFTMLPKLLKETLDYNVQEYSFQILTEGRKVAINALWGIHSDRAKALGFEGMSDLKECFDAIVYLRKVKGEYYALVDWGEGVEKDVKYQLPGPFVIEGRAEPVTNDGVPILAEPTGDVWNFSGPAEAEDPEPEPSEEESQAIAGYLDTHNGGEFSWNKATQAAFGEGKFGKNYTDKLKRILDKFSVDYSEYVSK